MPRSKPENVRHPRNKPPKLRPPRRARTLAAASAASDPSPDKEFEPTVKTDEPMPPPPPPPRVAKVEVLAAGKRERWQDRYSTGFAGGREGICVQSAQLYCSLLLKAVEFIESRGGTPIMGKQAIEETILPAAVLTFDKFMPDIDIGPETEVAIGSGLILGHAAIVAMKSRKKSDEGKRNGHGGAPRQEADRAEPAVESEPVKPAVIFDITDPKTVF